MRRARLRVELAESPPIAPEFPLHPDRLGQGMWAGSGTPLKDDPRGHSDFPQERTLASASHRPEGVIGEVLMNGMYRSAQKKNRSHAISFSCTTAISAASKGQSDTLADRPGDSTKPLSVDRVGRCEGESHTLIRPLGLRANLEQVLERGGHEGLEINGPLFSERVDEDHHVLAVVVVLELVLGGKSRVVLDEPQEVLHGDRPPPKQHVLAGFRGALFAPDGRDFVRREFAQDRPEKAMADRHEADLRFEPVPFRILHELAVRETIERKPFAFGISANRFQERGIKPEGQVLVILTPGSRFRQQWPATLSSKRLA